jgi:hypothetical protein
MPSTVPAQYEPPAPPLTFLPGVQISESFLATPEEAAEIDRQERERIARGVAIIDAALQSVWSCKACGTNGTALGSSLCAPCRAVAVQLDAEAHMGDVIGNVSRRELVEHYLSEQS